MSLVLKQLFDLVKLLNSDTGLNQLAAGVVCGMILGFAPVFSLQSALVFVLLFFFRIQISMAFLAAAFFAAFAWLLDPLFHQIGMAVLEIDGLKPLYTTLYNAPLIPLTRFNNSVVMGAGVTAWLLAIPVFFLSRTLIEKYRVTVVARFKGTKFWKAIQATGFYKWYLKYEALHGSA